MRALVTNDDGIASPGLGVLAAAAADVGVDVVIAAPSWDSSGASASLTAVEAGGRVIVDTRDVGVDQPTFGVEAAPAFIVRAAIHGAFGDPPDLVLSGVNNGPNTGRAVLHSGTVGAALTGATFGRPSAAFSTGRAGSDAWETAAEVIHAVVRWLAETPRAVTLNVNIPDVARGGYRGLRPATLSAGGVVQTTVTERGQGFVAMEYGPPLDTHEPGSDGAVLVEGYASVTPLLTACEASPDGLEGLLFADEGRPGRSA